MAKIDIIMPCYNAQKYIEKTIQSVLKQTENDFKLICIDDCSIDNTYTLLLSLAKQDKRILVLKNEKNCGIAETRNRGIRQGNSEYIAFLDNDDIMPTERLKIGKDYLDKNNEIGIVGGSYLIFDHKGNKKIVQKKKFYSAAQIRAILPFANIIPNGTTLIRRNIIEENNIYFHEEYGVEDYRFYSEMSKVTDINLLPDIMLEHRVFETQYSSVCKISEQLFKERQRSLDYIHGMLINNIIESCYKNEIEQYVRFVREDVKNIKIVDVIMLKKVLTGFKEKVEVKKRADYSMFCRAADELLFWVLKKYICQVCLRSQRKGTK